MSRPEKICNAVFCSGKVEDSLSEDDEDEGDNGAPPDYSQFKGLASIAPKDDHNLEQPAPSYKYYWNFALSFFSVASACELSVNPVIMPQFYYE